MTEFRVGDQIRVGRRFRSGKVKTFGGVVVRIERRIELPPSTEFWYIPDDGAQAGQAVFLVIKDNPGMFDPMADVTG